MSDKDKNFSFFSAYASDLFFSGMTSIPNLLLKYYKELKIMDNEMLLLIQLFRFSSEEKNYLPSKEELSQYLNNTPEEIDLILQALQQKNILQVKYFEGEAIGYDFEGLMANLVDYWVLDRAKKVELQDKFKNKLVKNDNHNNDKQNKEDFSALYNFFEKEFCRILSPIENDKLKNWFNKLGADLVKEALSRAVLMGVRNFKYIDSIILEWEKNNIYSMEELEEYDKNFEKKKTNSYLGRSSSFNSSKNLNLEQKNPDKVSSKSSKKSDLLSKLYIN